MYKDHVFCATCSQYFRKPFPRHCLCCTTLVRYARRGKKNKTPRYENKLHGGGHTHWIKNDILAAQAAGRL